VSLQPTPPWPFPERIPFRGRSVRLEPLRREHAGELWHSAQRADPSFANLRYGPFPTESELLAQVIEFAGRAEQPFWAVRPQSIGRAQGWLSLCDIYWRDRDRQHLVLAGAATNQSRDRGDLSADAIRDGRVAIPAAGLALQCSKSGVNEGGRPLRFRLRGHLAWLGLQQGASLRCSVVFDSCSRMAGLARGYPGMVGRRKFRRAWTCLRAAGPSVRCFVSFSRTPPKSWAAPSCQEKRPRRMSAAVKIQAVTWSGPNRRRPFP
jgi:hypothetical protein